MILPRLYPFTSSRVLKRVCSPSALIAVSSRASIAPRPDGEMYRFLAPFIDDDALRRLLPLPVDPVQRRKWLRSGAHGHADLAARLEARHGALRRRLGATAYLQLATLPLTPSRSAGREHAWHHVIGRPDDDILLDPTRLRRPNQTTPFLAGFTGYLHVCDHALRHALAGRHRGLLPVGCWGDVRRACLAAHAEQPKAAELLLRLIDRLIACDDEADAAGLSPAQRHRVRQTARRPLASLHRLASALRRRTRSGATLHTACTRLVQDWEDLTRHFETGETRLVNDLAELCLPLAAIARQPLPATADPEAVLAWEWVLSGWRQGSAPGQK